MDTTIFIDTVKFIDTVSIIDTLTVKTFTEEQTISQSLLELGKIIVPALMVFVGSYIAYRFGLRKDRHLEKQRLSDTSDHLLHSLDLLVLSCENQSINIKLLADELDKKVNQVTKHYKDINFHLANIDAIKINDIFKIFITSKKGEKLEKSIIYNKLNLSLELIRDVIEHYENDISELRNDTLKILEKLNDQIMEITKTINDYLATTKSGSMSLREQEFIMKVLDMRHKVDKLDTNNVFVLKKFVNDILLLAKESNVKIFIELSSKYLITFNNFVLLRSDYKEKFLTYSNNLKLAHEDLKYVIERYDEL